MALLVQDGVLELDREVAHYCPELAAEGKGELTLRELLAHRAGVIGVDGGSTSPELPDDRLIAERLAGQRPFRVLGQAYGYHAFGIGALTGEVVRRATGRSVQELFEERIRAPYALDFPLGLPEALEGRYVCVQPAVLTAERLAESAAAGPPPPDSLLAIAMNQHGAEALDLVEWATPGRCASSGPPPRAGWRTHAGRPRRTRR